MHSTYNQSSEPSRIAKQSFHDEESLDDPTKIQLTYLTFASLPEHTIAIYLLEYDTQIDPIRGRGFEFELVGRLCKVRGKWLGEVKEDTEENRSSTVLIS